MPEVCYVLEEKEKLFPMWKQTSNVSVLWKVFFTTFYVHSFETAERNIPFSCDITCFHGSEDNPHDSKGTLLK